MNWIDVTEIWLKKVGTGSWEELKEYKVAEVTYIVDKKFVGFCSDNYDKDCKIGKFLAQKLHCDVRMVPSIVNPKNIRTPDYLINGLRFDLKEPIGNGKNTFLNQLNVLQAENYVFDLSKNAMDIEVAISKIKELYDNEYKKYLDIIIIIKDFEVIKILQRNR